jgi:drug/metabolite transporter (DMT)-like permease
MANASIPSATASSRTLTGIACIVIGMCFFAAQDALMKVYLPSYPIWMLLFLRSCMAAIVLIPLILLMGKPHMLRTRFVGLHIIRGALFATGFSVFYMAFPFMGLAEATTIFFSAPLMIAVMAVVFLKERIGKHRIGALIIGFVGVIIAINPTGMVFDSISLLPLLAAFLYAFTQILARRIGDQESSITVGMYTLIFSGPVVLAMGFTMNQLMEFGPEFSHMQWAFPAVVGPDRLGVICIGLSGLVGYILLSRAYQVAEPSKISLFDYSYLPIATLVAWLIWTELPPMNTVIGMILVVGSGVYIGIREMRNAGKADEIAPLSETLTAPGLPVAEPGPDDDARH